MRINKLAIGYTALLMAFTTYMALDTFVIPEAIETNVSAVESETDSLTEINQATAAEPEISVTTYRVNDTNVYVADILLPSAEYLKTAFAQDTYGRKITASTSDMADENNAILAINGDYYGARERGYVIRNGVLYRDTPSEEDVLCIYKDGHMEIIDPSEISAEELIEQGVWQAFSFGPGLLEDGNVIVDSEDEVDRAMRSNPRTAIGIIDSGHYVFVVSDGRTSDNEGLTLSELAEFMESLGVQTAYNLDGGGSSTMVYQGEVINNPTTTGRSTQERSVSDIVYIG
ncbi:MAG: phosphodiester glycosidase family protein [Lachnospiraceae bacterium]|nr:phosphodiester glycosidase family protein [Lachnospiraceae bacterium]